MLPSPATRPRPLDAVVFDLDGVLVDSEELWGTVEERVLERLGEPWDPAIRDALLGTGPMESAMLIAEHLAARRPDADPVAAEEIATLMDAFSEEVFAGGVPVAPGAREVLSALHGRVRLAVATNSRRALARHSVGGNDLDRWLDTVVTADDVQAAKPAPDPYREACRRVGARPGHSVGIDDSVPGMSSARAAGLWVIGCVPEKVDPTLADACIRSLSELDVEALLADR